MQTMRKPAPLLVLGMLLTLLISACAPAGSGNTAGDVLNKSAQVMQKLTSASFALNLSLTTNLGSILPTGAASMTGQSATNSNFTVTAQGKGQAAVPDQSSLDLQIHMPSGGQNQDTQLSTIVKDQKVYVKGSDGQWRVSNQKTSLFSSIQPANYDKLLSLANKAQITDHGTQSRNGENLRHITLSFDKTALNDVLTQLGPSLGLSADQQQLLTQFVGKLTVKTLNFDPWIDEATSYVHHMDFSLDVSLDLSSLKSIFGQSDNAQSEASSILSSLPSTASLKLDLGFDLSKFNQPVTITAPANAIPADDSNSFFMN